MSGNRKKKEPSLLGQLVRERGINSFEDVHELVKELTKGVIQQALDAELEDDIGYSEYDT